MTTPSARRVASRYGEVKVVDKTRRRGRVAARPIRLNRGQIRDVRDALVRKLKKWADRNREPSEALGVELRRPIATTQIRMEDVAGRPLTADIHLLSKKSANPLYIVGAGAGKNRRTGVPAVIVFLNAKDKVSAFTSRGSSFPDHLMATLQHELTHVADTFAKKPQYEGGTKKMVEGDPEMDWDAYYNDPQEVRAFMREIFEQVRENFPKFVDVFGHSKGLEYALKSSDWRDIKKHLTPRNRKLMLKGIYTALQDEGMIP
jgi:hypothetical protein